jgi:hypothetical protein
MTRLLVALSTAAAVIVMLMAQWQIGLAGALAGANLIVGLLLLVWMLVSMRSPSTRPAFILYKLASLYMLGSMALIIVGAVL